MCAVVQAPDCREYTTKELIWANVYPLVQDVVVQCISLIGSGSLKLPHIISSHCPHGTRDASYDHDSSELVAQSHARAGLCRRKSGVVCLMDPNQTGAHPY